MSEPKTHKAREFWIERIQRVNDLRFKVWTEDHGDPLNIKTRELNSQGIDEETVRLITGWLRTEEAKHINKSPSLQQEFKNYGPTIMSGTIWADEIDRNFLKEGV